MALVVERRGWEKGAKIPLRRYLAIFLGRLAQYSGINISKHTHITTQYCSDWMAMRTVKKGGKVGQPETSFCRTTRLDPTTPQVISQRGCPVEHMKCVTAAVIQKTK